MTYLTSGRFLIIHMIIVAGMRGVVVIHILNLHGYWVVRRRRREGGKYIELVPGYLVKDGVSVRGILIVMRGLGVGKGILNMDPDN